MEHDRFPTRLSLTSPREDPEIRTSAQVIHLESDAGSTSREASGRVS